MAKWKDEWKIHEGVFDESTLRVLNKLANDGYIDEFNGVISTGKEADVFHGKNAEGAEIAIKIYRYETSTFQSMIKYIRGDHRFENSKINKRDIVPIWAKKEFKNLEKAVNAGIYVPKPIISRKNVLIMEFIGRDGISAPIAKVVTPKKPKIWLQKVLNSIKALYQKESLIHGDLSEYNILNFEEKPVIIDMGQAVLKDHPSANELLMKDIENILKWFKKLKIDVPEAKNIYKDITKK